MQKLEDNRIEEMRKLEEKKVGAIETQKREEIEEMRKLEEKKIKAIETQKKEEIEEIQKFELKRWEEVQKLHEEKMNEMRDSFVQASILLVGCVGAVVFTFFHIRQG